MNEHGGGPSGGDRVIARVADVDSGVSLAGIAALLAGSWVGTYALDGTQSVGPQLFHIPVIVAAVRFGHLGGLVCGVVAGVLCGPLMPLDVDAGVDQSFGNWFARLLLFVVIGQIVAAFQSRSLVTARRRLIDQRVRRRVAEDVAAGRFVPVFQPIVELSGGRIVGVEALARRRRDDDTLDLPAAFIPDAERTGCVVDIDDVILAASCRQLADWVRTGSVDDRFHVAVNLSASDLDDPTLVDRVRAHLAAAEIDPARLVLELTETSLASDASAAVKKLIALREVGVGIALDDFGVGQSSLGSLGNFPIDRFKIDRSFTIEVTSGLREATFVKSVINLAEALALEDPIAEGIETDEQLDALVAAGARWGQGYLFGMPAPAADLEDVLASGRVTRREMGEGF